MKRLIWDEAAQQDFDAAIAFLEEQSPAAARRIGDRILGAVALLKLFPKMAPASRHRGLRQLVVGKTPYLVVYRIYEGHIEIRAVVHMSRKRRK